MKDFNNVCFCQCHEGGKSRCPKCAVYHRAAEPAATHPNDESNPSYDLEENKN